MRFTAIAALVNLTASFVVALPTADANAAGVIEERGTIEGRANDYPYGGSCGGVDPWNFYKCQCTSFVAWRINDRKGINFHNQYKGQHWGNANLWNDAAKASGVTVNSTPRAGSIAQTDAGTFGHVAWVKSVSGSQVTIEEFNYVNRERYSTRTVAASTFRYIHL